MMCICLRGQQDALLRASLSFYPHCGASAAAEQEKQRKKKQKTWKALQRDETNTF